MKKLIQFATDSPIASAVIVVGVFLLAYYLIWGRKSSSVAPNTSTALGSGTSTGLDQRVVNGGLPLQRKATVINERLKGGGVPSGARVGGGAGVKH